MLLSFLPMLADFKYRDMQNISSLLSQCDEIQCGSFGLKKGCLQAEVELQLQDEENQNMPQHFVIPNIPPFGVLMLHSMCNPHHCACSSTH